jgi:nucleolar pre-ribosomal-associated protein 2
MTDPKVSFTNYDGDSVLRLTFEQLNSAEGVTRFLRSRDVSNDELVKVSNLLLDDLLDVYLPNKRMFVLELVCERLSDAKFSRFRSDPRVWSLLNRSYESLRDFSKIRNRTLQNFKAGDAIIGALTTEDTVEKELFLSIMDTVRHIRLNVATSSIYDQVIPILTSTLAAIINNKDISIDIHVTELVMFFKSAVNMDKLTKKFINNFITSAVPVILQTIESASNEESKQPLLALLRDIILNKEQHESITETTKLLLTSSVTSHSAVTFFKFIINSLPRLETAKIEELYSEILKVFPETSEDLLEFISSNNRALSSPFLQSIFEAEVLKESKNWKLIRSVLRLDVEVGLKNAETLMTYLEDEGYDQYISVVHEIINAFIKSRYLSNFFQLWFKLLETSEESRYRSSEFQKLASESIHNLSVTQLQKLIEDLNKQKSNSKYIVLSAIVQGIFSLKDKVTVNQVKPLFASVFLIDDNDDNLWNLKYQLLSLYDDILSHEELKAITNRSRIRSQDKSVYKYFTFFRIREVVEFDATKCFSYFIKFVSDSTDLQTKLIKLVFKRWFVLVNSLFSSEQISTLVNVLLSFKNEQLLIEVFQNDEIFEQSTIIDALIDQISVKISSEEDLFNFDILKLIPIQCYPKRLKHSIIESLTTLLKSGNSNVLPILINILDKTPSFKAKIEIDIKKVQEVVSTDLDNAELFKIIWNNHAKNSKESISSKFISESIKTITKSLKKKKKKSGSQLFSEFYIALIILTNKGIDRDQISELKAVFTTSVKSLLETSAADIGDTEEHLSTISWLLLAIKDLNLTEAEFGELKDPLKTIGQAIQNSDGPKYNEAKLNLFILLSNYSTTSSSLEYFESLFILLRRSGLSHDSLREGLVQVFKKAEVEKFNSSFSFCLDSLKRSSDIGFTVEIVTCHWLNLFKSNPESIALFVKSISMISLLSAELSNQSTILVVNSLRSVLTDRAWLVSQYGLESIIAYLSSIVNLKLVHNDKYTEDLFISITLTMSNVLLFHRFRLSNRHHLLVSIFGSLLKSLTNSDTSKFPNPLKLSKKSAQALARLLSNLCEPNTFSSSHNHGTENNKAKLSTTTAVLKRGLRKHIHVILLTYIHLSLKYSYNSEVRESLLPGIFNIFDVLSQNELNLVNTSLNHSGRTYYRSLYDEYKKIGKWQID